ncbi:MAG: hypothetical protein JXK05_12860 [Campylobacterales bacterium]|nr:hypothetical protein [Campylobacterales bacterium]
MRRFALLLTPLLLWAYTDSDFDGVEDALDRCAATPFSDLVDHFGCTVTSLYTPQHFRFSLGALYSEHDQSTQAALQSSYLTLALSYTHNALRCWIETALYTQEDQSGWADSALGLSYALHPTHSLTLEPYAILHLPTYDTQGARADYTAGISTFWTHAAGELYTTLGYTLIGDADYESVHYQNSASMTIGYGLWLGKTLFASIQYGAQESIYEGEVPLESLGPRATWSIDAHNTLALSYDLGLSTTQSRHSASVLFSRAF